MELTQDEAIGLLRDLAKQIEGAKALLTRLDDQRARIVAHFDGQEGMTRARMAEALGVSVGHVQRMVALHRPSQEAEHQPVTMPDALRRDLEAVVAIADDLLPALRAEEKKGRARANA